jgi:TnpA family transposase
VVLEQQTELTPTEIMTDTGAYTDVVFGLFWLLGYRFSPRIADIGGAPGTGESIRRLTTAS